MHKVIDLEHTISAISEGNTASFTVLYDYFWKDLLNYVYKNTHDVTVAEDIIHDLFLSIWNNRKRLQEIHNIKAYLYSGARYLTIKHFKRKQQHPEYVELGEIHTLESEVSIEDRLYYRYILDLLHEAIDELPEKCKLIFQESRINHKSIKQIAMEHQIAESTVENHINKALRILKKKTNYNMHLFLCFF